jgi:tRNA1(Val) A37 N6-methylase TrmN6
MILESQGGRATLKALCFPTFSAAGFASQEDHPPRSPADPLSFPAFLLHLLLHLCEQRVVEAMGPSCVVVDPFAGAGGNAIQLAAACARVIAIERDPDRADILKHNAGVYGVHDRLEVHCADFFDVVSTLKADIAFFSPPWGGPEYSQKDAYDLSALCGPGTDGGLPRLLELAYDVMGCKGAAVWLPRNTNLSQLNAMLPAGWRGACEVEREVLNGVFKAVTVYLGALAKGQKVMDIGGEMRYGSVTKGQETSRCEVEREEEEEEVPVPPPPPPGDPPAQGEAEAEASEER